MRRMQRRRKKQTTQNAISLLRTVKNGHAKNTRFHLFFTILNFDLGSKRFSETGSNILFGLFIEKHTIFDEFLSESAIWENSLTSTPQNWLRMKDGWELRTSKLFSSSILRLYRYICVYNLKNSTENVVIINLKDIWSFGFRRTT